MFNDEPKYNFWGKVALTSAAMLAVLGACYNGQMSAEAASEPASVEIEQYGLMINDVMVSYGNSNAGRFSTLEECRAAGERTMSYDSLGGEVKGVRHRCIPLYVKFK